MVTMTYARPYQYVNELRLLTMVRTTEHTMFIGTGFADDAYAWVEKDGVLERLDQVSINTTDYDVLTTGPFQAKYPFTVYVVNPNDEEGHASNALTFTRSDQIAVIDVKVNDNSVVENQVANIDLTPYMKQIKQADRLYGTDEDGNQKMYDVAQISGVQKVTLNGQALTIKDNTLVLEDIAKQSGTVTRVSTSQILYGTDISGDPLTYEVASFARTTDLNKTNDSITKKQDKDVNARDGQIAVMRANQSVGSNTMLADLISKVTDSAAKADQVDNIKQTIQNIQTKVDSVSIKDWKGTDPNTTGIQNNPIEGDYSSVTITDLTAADEESLRASVGSVAIGSDEIKTAPGAVSIGQSSQATGSNGVAVGHSASAATGVAIGQTASAADTSVSIGTNAHATNDSVALGNASKTTDVRTVAVGDTSATTPLLRRIVGVADPTSAQDAATKAYVDAHSGGGTGGSGSGGLAAVTVTAPLTGNGTSTSPLNVSVASSSSTGVIKVGAGLAITGDGTLSVTGGAGGGSGSGSAGTVKVVAPLTGDGSDGKPLGVSYATADAAGVVKPDGKTITLGADGLISVVNGGGAGSGLTSVAVSEPITGNGTSTSPLGVNPASKTKGGIVKIGDGLDVSADGTISIANGSGGGTTQPGSVAVSVAAPLTGDGTTAKPITAPVATASSTGLVKPGTGLSVAADGTLSVSAGAGGGLSSVAVSAPVTGDGTTAKPITVPLATASTTGLVKPGAGLTVDASGALSVDTASVTPQQKGLPTYAVNQPTDKTSIQGDTISGACILMVIGTTPPQIIYSDGK